MACGEEGVLRSKVLQKFFGDVVDSCRRESCRPLGKVVVMSLGISSWRKFLEICCDKIVE